MTYTSAMIGILSRLGQYRDVVAEPGKKYGVWFTRPTNLTDDMIAAVYADMNVFQRYADFWNRAYKDRFAITKAPALTNGGSKIYIEGIGGKGETFGKLALDQYWARDKPLYLKKGLFYERRGVEGVKYAKVEEIVEPMPEPYAEPRKFPTKWVVLGGLGLVAIAGTVMYLKSRREQRKQVK